MITRTTVISLLLGAITSAFGEGKRVDCWWEEPRQLVLINAEGKAIEAPQPGEGKNAEIKAFPVGLDFADKQAGDFSLAYTGRRDSSPVTLALTGGPYVEPWKLGAQWTLNGWIKAQIADQRNALLITLVDAAGKQATSSLGDVTIGQWKQFALTLKNFKTDEGFNFAAVASIRFGPAISAESKVWFDDVHFSDGSNQIGVTDKSIDQRMAETAASHARRVKEAFDEGAERKSPKVEDDDGDDRRQLDRLYAGRDIAEANEALRAFFQSELELVRADSANLWTLSLNSRLINAYYKLGSKSELKRLEPATEKLLLELLWERTKDKNDIHLTRWSTWWMVGSENHDLNAKGSSLITSRIFMNEPEYSSRIYPDAGHGDGHGYWFHDKAGRKRGLGPEGRANLKDGKEYTAKDHYVAWVAYFNEYFAERAKKGLWLERASPGYFKWSMSFVELVHEHCGDETLKHQTRQFLDLAWADWAQEQIAGIRGGPKTRHHGSVGGYDSATNIARFYSGGDINTNLNTSMHLLSSYKWPRVVWEIALDRESMGSFAITSRGIGEEEQTRPRPLGTERSTLGNCVSRLLKYSWNTPEYILGAQMDHPDAVYNHLAQAGRWGGLIVGATPAARVVLTGGLNEGAKPESGDHDMEFTYHAVQDRNVLIMQQARRWTSIHPDWYPAQKNYDKPCEVYIGKAWDQIEEENGWIFLQKANAYAAVRVVSGKRLEKPGPRRMGYTDVADPNDHSLVLVDEKPYEWNEAKVTLKPRDRFSPVIIEAGRKADYATFADFRKAILANPLMLKKAAVPGFYLLTYRGSGKDAKELFYNAANPDIPTIAGQPVNYTPAKVFDSPFIQSEYNSGIVTLKGDQKVVLDFNKALKQ